MFGFAKRLVSLGGLVFALALVGCNGGGSMPSATTLDGMAMAGPFLSGTVCAYRVDHGAKGALLGSCASIVGATSSFSVAVGDYTGDVLVEVDHATYDDEANANDNIAGTPLTGTLRNLVHVANPGGTITMAVTPLTEAALRLAGANLDAAAVQAAYAQLANMLPLGANLDLGATLPDVATDAGLAYRELLRALSQMQWGAAGAGAFAGDLNGFLTNLVGQVGSNGNTVAADLLAQLNSGLNSHCAIAAGALTCSVASGGGNGGASVTCNTGHYQAGAVHQPTANELATYAKTYSGHTGTFDMGGFTPSGNSAVFVLAAAGTMTYNGAAQTVNSICVDNTHPMIYVEFGANGGVDFFSDGSFTGNLSDGTGVSSAAGNSGGSANPTSGTAANGSPALDMTKCGSSMALGNAGGGMTMNMHSSCGAGAIADFSNLTVVDQMTADHAVCSASYSNGVLTVSNGVLTASVSMNGDANDSITTWVSGATEMAMILAPVAVNGVNAEVAKIRWKADGTPDFIQGGTVAVGGVYQLFTCTVF